MEALNSLKEIDEAKAEIIIVNDGSTDPFTNDLLKNLKQQGLNVIFQENKGLGAARNTGISHAKGKYILPLDADNKIKQRYIDVGIEILDKEENVAVVYGNAEYIGDKQGILKPGSFNLQRMMLGNYIDACAIIRKSVLEELGYYDNMKVMGLEDWDLWLRIAFKGYKLKYIDEVLFYYRVTGGSMLIGLNRNFGKLNESEAYFIEKYSDKLDFGFAEDVILFRVKKNPFRFFYRYILRKYFPGKYERLIRENKITRGYIY